MLYTARYGTVSSSVGSGIELQAVAAVVIGGVAIFGGSGTVWGAAIGAFLLVTINRALPSLGIEDFWQRAVDRRPDPRRDRPRSGRWRSVRHASSPKRGTPHEHTRRPEPHLPRVLAVRCGGGSWSPASRAVIALTVAVILYSLATCHNFDGPLTLKFLLQDIAPILLIALPMTLIIITGEIDLSVASIMGLSSVLLGVLHQDGMPIPAAALLALLAGAPAVLLNGFLVAYVGLPSLAVTIGTLALYRGIAVGLLGTKAVTDFTERWTDLATGTIGETQLMPMVMIPFAVLAVGFVVLLHFSTFGRGIYDIGLNSEAAHFTGVNVARTKLILFVLSGVVSAFAGIYFTLRFGTRPWRQRHGLRAAGDRRRAARRGLDLRRPRPAPRRPRRCRPDRRHLQRSPSGARGRQRHQHHHRAAAGGFGDLPQCPCVGLPAGSHARLRRLRRANSSQARGTRRRLRNQQKGQIDEVPVEAGGGIGRVGAQRRSCPHRHVATTRMGSGDERRWRRPVLHHASRRTSATRTSTPAPQGAEEAAGEVGATIEEVGPETGEDPAGQVPYINTAAQQGVERPDPVGQRPGGDLCDAVDEARSADVKVVTFDADTNPDCRDLFVNQATAEGIAAKQLELISEADRRRR